LISAGTITLTFSGIVGFELAQNKLYATLPAALMGFTAAVFSVPASLLMRRIGRAKGFLVGSVFGVISGLVSAVGIIVNSYVIFCMGVAAWGICLSFGQYYRFAAAESVERKDIGRAVSIVIGGGVAAVIFGPNVSSKFQHMIPQVPIAASYIAISVLCVVLFFVILTLNIPSSASSKARITSGASLNSSSHILGIFNGVLAYGIMVFVMTATPLAMLHQGHSVEDVSSVIQLHLLGMFVPSLLSVFLVERFGEEKLTSYGQVLLFTSAILAASGDSVAHYSLSLLLLGVGWNFMFVTSTSLISKIEDEALRSRAQSCSEVLINSVTTAGALFAGVLLHLTSWTSINNFVIVVVGFAFVVTHDNVGARKRSVVDEVHRIG